MKGNHLVTSPADLGQGHLGRPAFRIQKNVGRQNIFYVLGSEILSLLRLRVNGFVEQVIYIVDQKIFNPGPER